MAGVRGHVCQSLQAGINRGLISAESGEQGRDLAAPGSEAACVGCRELGAPWEPSVW